MYQNEKQDMNKEFTILVVTRKDLLCCFHEKDKNYEYNKKVVEGLSDTDMVDIATWMRYIGYGSFYKNIVKILNKHYGSAFKKERNRE